MDLFNSKDINRILQYLNGRDWINLLVVCKSWNKTIIPAMWEQMTPMTHYPDSKQTMCAYKKNGHYIKHLDLTPYVALPTNRMFYPNAITLDSPLSYYLKKRNKLKGLLLNGLIYDGFVDDLTMEEYIFANEIPYELIFSKLTYLNVQLADDFFKNKIISILPSTITSLELKDSFSPGLVVSDLFDKLICLKRLLINNLELTKEEFKLFTKTSFPQLLSLTLEFLYISDCTEMILDFNLYPKLKKLRIWNYITLKFEGISCLTHLVLEDVKLSKHNFDPLQFPNLNVLEIRYCSTILTKHIYSILKLPKLTYLDINTHDSYLFLLEEVYPNHNNNLVTLELSGFSLGYSFLNYFYRHCMNVERLSLGGSIFNFEILSLSKYNINDKSKLNYILLDNFNHHGSEEMLKYLLKLFQNIKKVEVTYLTDFSHEFIVKYHHIVKSYF